MNHLPHTLAHPLEEAEKSIESNNWFRALNHQLDFFETGASYSSIVLLALFRKNSLSGAESVSSNVVNAVKKIDSKRPLSFGDWVNDILAPLCVEAAKQFPSNSFVLDLATVAGRKNNIFLPHKGESGVVQIRNRFKGHGTSLSDSHYKDVVLLLRSRAEIFAKALSGIAECGVDLTNDLYPLVHTTDQGYEYVFQTLNDEAVSFVSTDENAFSLSTERFNSSIDSWIQVLVPSFDIAKDLNINEMVLAMQDASQAYMMDIYSQKKYNREQFVERDLLNASFLEFIRSDRVLFPLPGEAGQGKTNQLCHWTEKLMENGEGVLIFSGGSFSNITLENRLREVFGLSPKKNIHQYLERMNHLFSDAGKIVYVFIDAVNEAIAYHGIQGGVAGPLQLYRDLYELFGKKELDRFKLLFTCRNYTWYNELVPEQAHQDHSLFYKPKDESGASVHGFTDSEVRKAYAIYGELYQMETAFDSLNRGYVLRLKDPLMMKVACTNSLGRELPSNQNDYTSLALFSRMLDDISHSYAGRNQINILKEISRYMLFKYVNGEAVDSILIEDLKAALQDNTAPLYKAASLIFNKDGITVAFAELLNRPERPVLRMVEQTKIQFIYERFLEYLLAITYIDSYDAISPESMQSTLEEAATNEVFMGTMRNVLLLDYLKRGSAETAIGLLELYGEDIQVFTVVSGMMDVLVKELYMKEVFDVERSLLKWQDDGLEDVIKEYNSVCKLIDSNIASDTVINRYKELSKILKPILRLRSLAGNTLISGILLSDAHNEGLYSEDPYTLFWLLMDDPMTEVTNNACMQAYYVSKRTLTLNNEPLNENITQQIIRRIFEYLKRHPLPSLFLRKKARNRTIKLLEASIRLDVILIIDLLLDGQPDSRIRVKELLDKIRSLLKHLTLNYSLIRIFMPFFSGILRRQLTFQSDYVNNIKEYSSFWDKDIIAVTPTKDGRWNRQDITRISPMLFLYSRYSSDNASLKNETPPSIEPFADRILKAYSTGDSLSYFLMERLLVIFGLSDWKNTLPILQEIDHLLPDTEWFDYSQMSFIYVLYQLGLKMESLPPEVEEMLVRNCIDWTYRCRGYFKARNSDVANPLQLYKRNVMSWYAMVWCSRHGDCSDSECRNVPVFREMLNTAIVSRDKELLVHLVNNIAELITDSGDIYTALDLIKVIYEGIPSNTVLREFEINLQERYPDTSEDLVALIGKILGTAKNYYPLQVNDFLTRGSVGLSFPGISKYKDDILTYNPSGEKLSDLLTHKFGNFIIWGLIHEESIDKVVVDCFDEAAKSTDSIAWFERCARIVLGNLLCIRI